MQTNTNKGIIYTEENIEAEEQKTETTQEDTNVILEKETKKINNSLLKPIIVLFVLGVLGAGAYVANYFMNLNNPNEDFVSENQELLTEQEIVEIDEEVEEMKEFNIPEFMSEMEEFLINEFEKNNIENYKIYHRTEDERSSEFAGKEWFLENGDLALIKRYASVYFDIQSTLTEIEPEKRKILEDNAKDGFSNILTNLKNVFIQKGFIEKNLNAEINSDINTLAFFENNEVLCKINVNTAWVSITTTCGHTNDLEKSELYTEMYKLYDKKETLIEIYNVYENFALLTRSLRGIPFGGGWVIAEKVDGAWEEKIFSQDVWNCRQLFEWGVTPELFFNREEICYDEEKEFPNNQVEYGKYYQGKKGL